MIREVLFDYGGVLSTGGRPGTLYNVVSEHFGVPRDELDLDEFHDQLRRGVLCSDDFFAAITAKYGKDEAEPLTVTHYIEAADYIQRHAKIVYELASVIRTSGVATGILSNVYRMSARQLAGLGRYDNFDPVILSCYEGLAKPDPEFFKLAVERTGIEPTETLFIDDQERNLVPARNLGMVVVKSVTPQQVVSDVVDIFRDKNGVELPIAA